LVVQALLMSRLPHFRANNLGLNKINNLALFSSAYG